MKKEVMELWVEALPKYKQGYSYLRQEDNFCCLGVLCHLASQAGVCKEKEHEPTGTLSVFGYDGDTGVLPASVKEWAGLHSVIGSIIIRGGSRSLVQLNDSGASFEVIAETIRQNWEQL